MIEAPRWRAEPNLTRREPMVEAPPSATSLPGLANRITVGGSMNSLIAKIEESARKLLVLPPLSKPADELPRY